jgi:PAS domain S-box-containing protein
MSDKSKKYDLLIKELNELQKNFDSLKESYERDITERLRAEEALILSESNLQALINNKNQSIWSLDTSYCLIVCNDYFRNAYLAAYNEELKLGVNLVELLSPELKGFWKPKYDVALAGEKISFQFSAEIQGVQFHFDVYLSPIYTEGVITGVSALSIDITDHKKAEEALQQSERLLKESQSVAHLGTYVWDISTGLWKSSDILDDIFGIDENYVRSHEGWVNLIHPDFQENLRDYVLNNIIVKHHRFDKEYKIIRHNDGHERWVHCLGEVELDDNRQVIFLIGTISDITDRKNAEEALLFSESNLQALINNKNESIWSLDKNYNLIICNDFFRNSYLAAYNIELVLGINLVEILSPELKEFWKPKYDSTLKGEKITFEFTEKILGRIFNFEVFLNPIYSVGKITGVSALSVDITERKRAEQELQESEFRFSQLAKASFEGIGISDNDIVIDANEQLARLLGYSQEDLIGMNSMNFIAAESRELVIKNQTSEIDSPYEHLAVRKDGTVFPVEVHARTVPYKRRMVRVTAIRDITERKLAEKALREANLKLKIHIERTPMAVIEWDLDFRVTQWNPSAQTIFGFSREEALGQHASFIIPKEILPVLSQVWHNLLIKSGGERNTNQNITKEGRTIFCEWYNTPLIDELGKVTGVASIAHDITSRKEAEEAVLESERKFRQFVETAVEGIMALDEDDIITFVNPRMSEMIGYKHEELIGQKITSFMFPEDLIDYQEKMGNRRTGKGEILERRYKHKDGSILWTLVSGSPIFNNEGEYSGSLGMLTDITDRKAAEEILHESELLTQKIIENAPFGAHHYSLEAGQRLIFRGTNPAADKILGVNNKEFIGKTIEEAFPALVQTNVPAKYKKVAATGEGYIAEEVYYNHGNISGAFEVNAFQTTPNHMTAFFVDITDRKKAEIALIKSKEKAEESDRLKSSFLANMSHEIRTPMNGILGFAELLKNPDITGDEQEEYISIIEKSGVRMLNILNDLIDLSKIESGQVDVNISVVNINKQTDYIYAFFKPEVDGKGIKFSVKNSLSANEAFIKTDKDKVNAILTNLVKNAIKFTHHGSIEFGYVLKPDSEPAELEFYVKDTGVGIPKEQQGIIFERFRQGSESLTRNYEGAGLGLSISKSFVNMLGGKIWVESLTGKNNELFGSIFHFTIPYHNSSGKKSIPGKPVYKMPENKQIKKLNILIAEDDESSVFLISRLVKEFSKEIISVRTGIEAVDTCQNNPQIDLVLMDIKMPEMDGYEATTRIRQFNKKVIIIAQTAFALAGDRNKAIEAGCNDYIPKPISQELLTLLIEKHFQ